MRPLRFLCVKLSYGRHTRGFELPAQGANAEGPVVITGPNGSGKTTLIEGLVRTLFGFNRRAALDGREIEWRQPWGGGPASGRVELCDPEGNVVAIERELDSNDVSITTAGGPTEVWRGDGNPAATNASACDYRQRLEALVGFGRLETYELTAFVRQGSLLGTRVDQNLLRAAAGSPVDVERALAAIEQDHRRFTREPVVAGKAKAQKPREKEAVAERIAELEAALAAARAAESARAPLLAEQDRLNRTIASATTKIEALESAQLVLARRDALAVEIARLEERIATNERRVAEIERARAELALARTRLEELGERAALPDDFAERAAALEQLWPARERVAARCEAAQRDYEGVKVQSGWWWIAPALLVVAATAGWMALDAPLFAWGGLAAAIATTVALFVERRHASARQRNSAQALDEATRELEATDRAVDHQLESIPASTKVSLTPESLPALRANHARRREVEAVWTRTEDAHRTTLHRIASASASASTDEAKLIASLQHAVTRDRNERAEKRLRFEEISRMALALPEGVRDDLQDVQHTLTAARSERSRAEHDLRATAERLSELRPSIGPAVLEAQLAALGERLTEVDESADAARLAYELLDEAHSGFRRDDQRRLVDCISAHLSRLSGGTLGPLDAPGDLAAARLHAFGRELPLDSPPLSYGQLHLVLLAVRLGAADFMAQWGQAVPLIIDEPFANLDEDNAAAVWQQLTLVARDRQVIVATQESALLERLGVRPSVVLGPSHVESQPFRLPTVTP